MTLKFEQLYEDLMGGEYDRNDPIIIYMNNLKTQLNVNSRLKQLQHQQQNSVSLNSDDSGNNSHDYESSSQQSQSFDLTDSEFEDEETETEESIQYSENVYPNKRVKQAKPDFFSEKIKN